MISCFSANLTKLIILLSCNFMAYVTHVILIDKDFVTTLDIKQTMEKH